VSSEDYDRRFYGIYPGKCVDISDPERRSRIKLTVPQITGESVSNWALPCRAPSSSNGKPVTIYTPTGADNERVPALEAVVWVMFVGGDPNFPIWMGVL
jgi:hypothetical protein